jgi:hypothetical protein
MSIVTMPKPALAPAIGLLALLLSACGPRVIVSTGTTLGLKATPGDGSSRPPQVTLGYKRAELALVPTAGEKSSENQDAYSTLAAFRFETTWFDRTDLHSFIGSGMAAREVQQTASRNGEQPPTLERAPAAAAPSGSSFWRAFGERTSSSASKPIVR